MSSLSRRITWGIALGQFLVLGVGISMAYQVAASTLRDQFDEDLRIRAASYAAFIEQEMNTLTVDDEEIERIPPLPDGLLEGIQVCRGDGSVLYRSPALEDQSLPGYGGGLDTTQFQNWQVPEGPKVRLYSTRVLAPHVESSWWNKDREFPRAEMTFVLAREDRNLHASLDLLLLAMLGGGALLMVTTLWLGHLIARRSLAPLNRLGNEVSDLDIATLSGYFKVDSQPRELVPLIHGLNDLRSRVDHALRAQKRMGASLAHEFRTPISELRTLSQVALEDASDVEFQQLALRRTEEVSSYLMRLIELVRDLTEVDGSSRHLETEPLDLLEQVRAGLEGLPSDRFDLAQIGQFQVDTNRDALRSALRNLLSNAALYSPEQSEVECETSRNGERVFLTVTNDAPDLEDEHLTRLAEPFWRRNDAREEAGRHGLGLTIATGMTALAGIDLKFKLQGGRLRATLGIPLLAREAS